MKKNIIIYSILCLFVLYVVEQVLMLPYTVKTLIKLPMVLIFPVIIYKYKLKLKFSVKIKKSDVMFVGLWSLFVISAIAIAYMLLKSFIDIPNISKDLSDRMGLDKTALIYTGIYTIFINSFIEEMFFRGFIFQGLLKMGWNKKAYFLSSILFAIYHITIFRTWFNVGLTLLIMFGLFVGGLIFCYFVKRTESFLSSWIIHMSADLIIITIGFQMLGVLA